MSMRKFNDAMRIRTRYLPACSAVLFRNTYFGLEIRRELRFKIFVAMFTGCEARKEIYSVF